jgi:hypothetical protein
VLGLELASIEARVEPLLGQQFGVDTPLNNLALVQDEDLVSLADGAEAMGNGETGAAGHKTAHRLLEVRFGARRALAMDR